MTSPATPPAAAGAPTASAAWLPAVLLVVAVVAAFGPAVDHPYMLDAIPVVRDDPAIRACDFKALASGDWWSSTGVSGGLYRPVPRVVLSVLHQMSDGSPKPMNTFNVLMQAAVAVLRFAVLCAVLKTLRHGRAVAFLAALFAAMHPSAAEVVGSQVGAADLLATAFGTGALLLFLNGALAPTIMGALLVALAALSKESAVAYAVVAPLVVWAAARGDTRRVKGVLLTAIAAAAGVALMFVARRAALGTWLPGAGDPVYAGFAPLAQMATACGAFARYLLPLLAGLGDQLPVVTFQDVPALTTFSDAASVTGAVVLAAVVGVGLVAFVRGRFLLALGCGWFLAPLLPVLNLFLQTGAITAGRFLHPGIIGLSLALALAVMRLWDSGRPAARVVAVFIGVWFAGVAGVRARTEVDVWRDQPTLFATTVERAPRSSYGVKNLGNELVQQAGATRTGATLARAAELFQSAANLPRPLIPGRTIHVETSLKVAFESAMNVAKIAAEHLHDAARASRAFDLAMDIAREGRLGASTLPFRVDWNAFYATAVRSRALIEYQGLQTTPPADRTALVDTVDGYMKAAEDANPGAAGGIPLRWAILTFRKDTAAASELLRAACVKYPNDPAILNLRAQELRSQGKAGEALPLEVTALESADGDPMRYLKVGLEAVASDNKGLARRGRGLLSTGLRYAGTGGNSAEARTLIDSARRALAGVPLPDGAVPPAPPSGTGDGR